MSSRRARGIPSNKMAISEGGAKAPFAIGYTELPKVPLSHRWVIGDANRLLEKIRALESPPFPIVLPNGKKTSWKFSLSCSRERLRYSENDHMNAVIALQYANDLSISEVCLSLLNEDKVIFTTTHSGNNSNTRVTINLPSIHRYVHKDILTIQVDATIHCHANIAETLHEDLHKVPLDAIRKELHTLYKEEVLTDITIKCGGQEFKAHKAVLASQSPVLRKMFEVDMKEKHTNVVEISDIDDPAVMSSLLAYIYTGNASDLSQHVKELLNAANKYELPRLFSMCESELKKKLQVSSVVETLIWADLHNCKELKSACLRFIRCCPSAVKETCGWQHLKDNMNQYSTLLVEVLELVVLIE